MRRSFTMFLLTFLCLSSIYAQKGDFVVQLAAFDRAVSLDYFKGLNGVYHVEDHNNIHRYYIGGFTDEAAANASATEANKLGHNARVIDMHKVRSTCSLACGTPLDPTKIKSIFFDFDKYSLRSESKHQLDRLFELMIAHPDYNVELSAHTDAKGSNNYNNSLSINRANAAKKYLIAKGLSSTRINTSTFGEEVPIAKNEVNGKDTPKGRQYNRRVEIKIIDNSGNVAQLVEKIEVPSNLRQ